MGLFDFWKKKKKVIPQRKDYQDFKVDVNMKSLLLFEEMTDKSFYSLSPEDFEVMIYCLLVVNNNIKMTLSQFKVIMKNEKIAECLYEKCQKEFDFMAQFNKQQKSNVKIEGGEISKITTVINALILQCGLDVNYVMNEMKLWELSSIVQSMDEKTKADLIEKRFWTYMQILPHIDGKKCKSPEKLLPFPWEKETNKQNNIKFMEENKDAIMAFFNKKTEDEQ